MKGNLGTGEVSDALEDERLERERQPANWRWLCNDLLKNGLWKGSVINLVQYFRRPGRSGGPVSRLAFGKDGLRFYLTGK